MSSLDVRQLECFIAVAEEGHVGRAAARVHMTQPPMTRRIARLEREIGARLFLRTHLGVELTEAGRVLYDRVHRIVRLSDRALEETRLAAAGRLGTLNVGYFGAAAFREVPRLLRAFVERHPDVDVRLERASKNEQLKAIHDRRMHIGFCRYHATAPGLAVHRLRTDTLQVAIPETHRLRTCPQVRLVDLADENVVVFPGATRPGFADHVLSLFTAAGLAITPYRIADDVVTALCYVSIHGACAVVPGASSAIAIPRVTYRPMADSPAEDLGLLYDADDTPPLARAFLRFLQAGEFASATGPEIRAG
jgi:LysR family transcriptional regulator, benzoate and cis,cis-muconate-responsive activator of ben and cat genes